ncbi:TIGR02444 family protein [Pseudomonas sp. RP23018S]|uniref:TIGR02444 family protein n=1 Tax=Pseudomonas sp. RP23018S TaxID=3096037 RepID=UPI002ACAEF36|nr:TIGR02444 family protein [Pseudomonas sp. RP23018S]MDZ5604868.1 TIGR02444 family protein [Pseudomonas sp. RP23018S]
MPPDLWNYALALYGRRGVEAACLRLQDTGADVCLLLCACWLQARQVHPTQDRATALRSVSEPWQQEVIAPLRELRQRWKAQAQHDPQWAGLRGRIKGLELEAEQVLLERLAQCAGPWPTQQAPREDWLTWLSPTPSDNAALNSLRDAARSLQEPEG